MTDGLAFDSILNFMADLSEAFPGSSAQRYFSVLCNIRVSDKGAQEKHIKLFTVFCAANRTQILERDLAAFTLHKLIYDDEEEPFDIQEIFDHKDFEDNKGDILRHLLTISAIVDPESSAKQILASMENHSIFKDVPINDLFGQIAQDVQAQSESGEVDTIKTLKNIIDAEPFKKLVSTMIQKTQSGEVDLGNLFSGMSSIGKLMEGVDLPATSEKNTFNK